MIKHIKIALFTLFIASYFCSYSFAMQEEENSNIHVLKMALKAEETCKSLREENQKLSLSLKRVAKLADLLLDPETTPTTHSYLSALYNQNESKKNIEELYLKASNKQTIRNIIIDGHTKFKKDAPEANVKLLKIGNLFHNLRITEEYSTVVYGEVTIPKTHMEDLQESEETINQLIEHNTSNEFYSPIKKQNKSLIQDNIQGLSLDFNSKKFEEDNLRIVPEIKPTSPKLEWINKKPTDNNNNK